jgi:GNAT superfamily N-acetyltransferase
MSVAIREARESDHEALFRLFAAGDALHAVIRPEFFRAAPGPTRTLRSRPNERLLVAEVEGEVAGVAHVKVYDTPPSPLHVMRRRGHVDDVVVAEEHRRKGIGRALMERAASWCREQGASQLLLTVWEGNRAAEAFYDRLGYRPISRVLGLDL